MRAPAFTALTIQFLLVSVCLTDQSAAQTPDAAIPGGGGSVISSGPGTVAFPPRDNSARPPTAIGTGRIQGRVVSGSNADPVRTAQVRISSPTGINRSTTTDADGRFDFANVAAGRYYVSVSKPGFVQLQYGQARPFDPAKLLTLGEGQLLDRIDVALPRGSVITGRITDEFGEPMPTARVQVFRLLYGPSGQRRLIPGNTGMFGGGDTSDDRGEFRIFGLAPGSYLISAMPIVSFTSPLPNAAALEATAADRNENYATTYFPGVGSAAQAQQISVGIGQEASASFSLVQVRLSRISGFVRNSQGTPLTEGQISLRSAGLSAGFGGSGGTINRDGSFFLTNVAPGEYFIDVQPARTMVMGRQGPLPPPPADAEYASVPVAVDGSDLTGLVITTAPPGSIGGQVLFEGTAARPSGNQAVRVIALPADEAPRLFMGPPSPDSGVVDADGRFLLQAVGGAVRFTVNGANWVTKAVMLDGVDIIDRLYQISPGTQVTNLQIIVTDRRQEVSGSVRTAAGEAASDSTVVVVPAELPPGVLAHRYNAIARVEQDGSYRIRALAPGTYFAIAVGGLDQSAQWDPAFQEFVRTRGKQFSLGEGETIPLDLQLLQ